MAVTIPAMFETHYQWVVPLTYEHHPGNLYLDTIRLWDEIERVEKMYGARFIGFTG